MVAGLPRCLRTELERDAARAHLEAGTLRLRGDADDHLLVVAHAEGPRTSAHHRRRTESGVLPVDVFDVLQIVDVAAHGGEGNADAPQLHAADVHLVFLAPIGERPRAARESDADRGGPARDHDRRVGLGVVAGPGRVGLILGENRAREGRQQDERAKDRRPTRQHDVALL